MAYISLMWFVKKKLHNNIDIIIDMADGGWGVYYLEREHTNGYAKEHKELPTENPQSVIASATQSYN